MKSRFAIIVLVGTNAWSRGAWLGCNHRQSQ